MKIKPFLKWAGGKNQIIDKLSEKLPRDIHNVKEYYEPFIAVGLYFYILHHVSEILKDFI